MRSLEDVRSLEPRMQGGGTRNLMQTPVGVPEMPRNKHMGELALSQGAL